MTKQEMLASLEAQIRKDIPRLMELREGCVIEYFRNGRAYNCKVVETFPSYFNVYFDGEIESIDFELSENTFQIIGHDIMLNDVLEWLRNCKRKIIFDYKTGYFLDEFDYYYSFSSNYHESAPIENKIWNLSSPYLKDQPEKLIKFLYDLKQKIDE